jgi:cyclomaltodextrinase
MKKANIDGWRLDVANEVGHEFWREFRKLIKKVNPEAIILGEIWHIASPWLQGSEFDSAMNYPFRQLVADFFAKNRSNVKEFDEGRAWIRKAYRKEVNYILYNLIGSHDTPRFLTLCRGDVRKMMLAVIFQMTYLGMPVIYYGDERGMVGGADPDNRRAMDWGELGGQREKLFELYKKLVALRKNHPALKIGEFFTQFVDQKNNVYSYLKRSENQEILIVLNNSAKNLRAAIPSPRDWKGTVIDLLKGGKYEMKVKIHASLKPYSGLILKTA